MSDAPRPKTSNAWLLAFRKYHTWLGLAMMAFIVIVALTGIYLNHKDLFKGWGTPTGKPHTEKEEKEKPSATQLVSTEAAPGQSYPLSTATDLSTLPVSFSQALAACRERVGEQPVERIELKNDKGRLVYKIKAGHEELYVAADSGETWSRAKPEGKEKKPEEKEKSSAGDTGVVVQTAEEHEKEHKGGYDWGKIIKDLHTGKLGGLAGKLVVDLTAVVLVALSLTGVYLWLIPALRKRRSAKAREASANS